MASKRQARQRECRGKQQFYDHDSAKAAATSLLQDKGGFEATVRPYHCQFCKKWHIGRKKIRR